MYALKQMAVSIPISNFVKRVAKPAVGIISRTDQRRVFEIKTNVKEGVNVNAKVVELMNWIEENKTQFDPRVVIQFTGENEDQEEAQGFLMKAFVIAMFMMARYFGNAI